MPQKEPDNEVNQYSEKADSRRNEKNNGANAVVISMVDFTKISSTAHYAMVLRTLPVARQTIGIY